MEHQKTAAGEGDAEFEDDRRRGEAGAVAPDGGWGWVVLSATIVVMALTLAFPSCVGIFYTDLQNDFHASNSQTSWVPSIMTSVLHAGGTEPEKGSCLWSEFTGEVLAPPGSGETGASVRGAPPLLREDAVALKG